MPFIKSHEAGNTGAFVEYHELSAIVYEESMWKFQLKSYVSKEAKETGKEPLIIRNGSIDVDPAIPASEIYNHIYAKVKEYPDFTGAVDC